MGANADIKLEEFVRSSFYHYGGDKIRLELQVDDYMVDDLVDYFGNDISFREHNEQFIVAVDVLDSNCLYYWFLQHEQNVKVISPIGVKEKLIEKVKGILALYEEEHEI